MFIDEMNKKTKKTGKRLCTVSVEPVRSATQAPRLPNASEIIAANTSRTATPPIPEARRTPAIVPTMM